MPPPEVNPVTGSQTPTGVLVRPEAGRSTRFRYLDWGSWARAIITIRATPRQIALGVALGSFIAFTPFIGLQMLIAALFATVIGASRKAAMLAVWISNPVTMGPIFLVTYQLGVVLCLPATASAQGTVPMSLTAAEAPDVLVGQQAMTLGTVMHAGWGVLLPMLLGGCVIGLMAALLAYGLTHRGVVAYQAVRHKPDGHVADGQRPDNNAG